jgi:hypothetical protein
MLHSLRVGLMETKAGAALGVSRNSFLVFGYSVGQNYQLVVKL